MKIFIVLSLLFLSNGLFGQKGIVHVESNTFDNLIDLGNNQILDVRTIEEFEEGSINGSVNIDYWNPEFVSIVKKKFDKNFPLLVYCAGGGRSALAADRLRKKGFKLIYNLDGGYDSYIDR